MKSGNQIKYLIACDDVAKMSETESFYHPVKKTTCTR